jgi:hypothetical protein
MCLRADKLAKKLPAEINEKFTRGQEVRLEDTTNPNHPPPGLAAQ